MSPKIHCLLQYQLFDLILLLLLLPPQTGFTYNHKSSAKGNNKFYEHMGLVEREIVGLNWQAIHQTDTNSPS